MKQIYIIECQKHGVCKIGVSNDPVKRLKAIQTGYPWPLSIRMVVESSDAFAEESAIHRRYQQWRLEGEWFDSCVAADIEKSLAIEPVELSSLCKVHKDEMGEFYCHFDFIDNLELFCLDAPYPSLPIGTYRWWLWVAKELSVFAIGERGCRGTVLDVLNQCFTFIPEYITPSLKRFEAEATDWAWHCSPAEYKARIKDSQHFCTAPRDYCSIDDGVVAIPDKNAELSPWCKKYLLSHNYL